MSIPSFYFDRLAAAFVRSTLTSAGTIPPELLTRQLDALGPDQLVTLIQIGREQGLRLHKFKRTMELPRVRRVLGTLRGLAPLTLLDIGSGRGNVLWPLVDAFPELPIHAIDQNERRVSDIQAVHAGVASITAERADATSLPFGDNSFDVVTMLAVLDHIPAAEQALCEAVRVAQRFVVLSVPSKEDTNC